MLSSLVAYFKVLKAGLRSKILGYLYFPWTRTCNNFHLTKEILLKLNRILDCAFGFIHVLAV